MKNLKLNVIAASMMIGTLLLSGNALADRTKDSKEKPVRQMIKIKAEEGTDVKVFVGKNGEKNKYSFSAEELENMDNVKAKLGDLDQETLDKVVQLLGQLNEHEAKIVEFKDTDIKHGESESKIFMVKTGNSEGEMHIEIDVEGDGKFHEKRLRKSFFADGKGNHKANHKRMKWISEDGDKPEMVKVLKKLINKSELTDDQIEELKTLLDKKNQ
ncbi:hypothetical protein KO505_11635 [Psychrosphaera sp. F3M07]|uniref:hypothetical protein n=1 Tax=Psychrosphaera sp. F3M07 TaxID=2841560 RepID=UPI001C098570|nr:hypothetical protein [Psychrosphaera sp. F3M07]MBU2918599.1 hypothetical protein [Psychrosphaera sp. F3M07]